MQKKSERSETAKANVRKRKRGGQPGNQNALGNKGGAPIGNQNARKLGIYSRYNPPPYGMYAPIELGVALWHAQESGNEEDVLRVQSLIGAWIADQMEHGVEIVQNGAWCSMVLKSDLTEDGIEIRWRL